jgi:hypothetical protein
MSKQFKDIGPITSLNMIDTISHMLAQYNEDFSLMFHIIIDTDVPFLSLCDMKVSDLLGKSTITYPGMRNSDISWTEPISDKVAAMIGNRLKGRNPDEFAFVGSRSGKKMCKSSFLKALSNVSMSCGIDPPLSITSLHKTYTYFTFLKDEKKAYKHTTARSRQDLYNYLQLDLPDDIPYSGSPREVFYSSDLLSKTKTYFEKTISDIALTTERPDNTDETYYRNAVQCLNSICSSLDRFNSSSTE